ncbi:hypothetical protein ACN38_g5118 [Penicillium nordicum]|uniref:Uncharacterized protein n=1 Tax=Penicillium nordicum TaxID=229535 RepID=A0A0M8P278_9EURO|nr:hypothetical protein ACN38_g5118 [Penicillium nordicum]
MQTPEAVEYKVTKERKKKKKKKKKNSSHIKKKKKKKKKKHSSHIIQDLQSQSPSNIPLDIIEGFPFPNGCTPHFPCNECSYTS